MPSTHLTTIYSLPTNVHIQYTDVTSALICGGKKDVRSQEATLRNRPDVVVSVFVGFIPSLLYAFSFLLCTVSYLNWDNTYQLTMCADVPSFCAHFNSFANPHSVFSTHYTRPTDLHPRPHAGPPAQLTLREFGRP